MVVKGIETNFVIAGTRGEKKKSTGERPRRPSTPTAARQILQHTRAQLQIDSPFSKGYYRGATPQPDVVVTRVLVSGNHSKTFKTKRTKQLQNHRTNLKNKQDKQTLQNHAENLTTDHTNNTSCAKLTSLQIHRKTKQQIRQKNLVAQSCTSLHNHRETSIVDLTTITILHRKTARVFRIKGNILEIPDKQIKLRRELLWPPLWGRVMRSHPPFGDAL